MRRQLVFLGVVTAAALGGAYACSSSDSSPPAATDEDSGTGGDTGTTRSGKVTIAPVGDAGTIGTGTFVESNGQITLTLNVTGAPPGARGVHVHVNGDCANAGAHFNPNPTTRNGEFDNMIANDAGVGTLTSMRAGISLDTASDAGTGIVGRSLNVHGVGATLPDGGPVLNDAGQPVPPPRIGCGIIQLN